MKRATVMSTTAFGKLFRTVLCIPLLLTSLSACGGGGGSGSSSTVFEVTIENISTAESIVIAGESIPIAFSPVVFSVQRAGVATIAVGNSASSALESLAEDGNPGPLAEAFQQTEGVSLVGIAQTPVGETAPSVILPGSRYRLAIQAAPGDHLNLLTSFVQANDGFVAPVDGGIPLFDGAGVPLSGDITSRFRLYDAGTEINEQPGTGANQAPRQPQANTGTTENGTIQLFSDEFSALYPPTESMIRIVIAVASTDLP